MATKKKAADAPVTPAVKPAYVAAIRFRDIETNRIYEIGEVYENDNPDRLKALSTKSNASGKVLIKKQ